MTLPLVAIIGRPNVGKSTLFNRLTSTRKAIVGDEPGITRDRMYGEVEWLGRYFRLVDTGGIVPDDDAIIPANIFIQAGNAIDEAFAIIWVVDARSGITPLDEELVQLLRNTGKPVYIAANKCESSKVENESLEFLRFGFDITPVSAEHGNGVGDLLDKLFEVLPELGDETRATKDDIKLAIIGRPNVGKSSLLNCILGEERTIVSPIAGTTRDAIDTFFEFEGRKFTLIDTAGIRRRGKTTEMAEKLSVIMAKKALERADVALMVIDAVEGVTHLDASIAGIALDSGCSIVLAVNKWDAVPEKETGSVSAVERELRREMKFLSWAPILTISALNGQRVPKILPIVIEAYDARKMRITTSKLNDFFEAHVNQPHMQDGAPSKGGKSRLKVQFLTQSGTNPPLFILFTSGGQAGLHFSYTRYIENRLREEFGFFASPIKLIERHKSKPRKGENAYEKPQKASKLTKTKTAAKREARVDKRKHKK